jgi:hypothetical protein
MSAPWTPQQRQPRANPDEIGSEIAEGTRAGRPAAGEEGAAAPEEAILATPEATRVDQAVEVVPAAVAATRGAAAIAVTEM